jgi:NAD(P)-dependent dehydrogenase (short-subunit alcohol dehydrogenase family)
MNEVACKPQGPVYRCQAGSDFDKAMFARTPHGRIWTANDIAASLFFGASDDSAWLIGERLRPAAGCR